MYPRPLLIRLIIISDYSSYNVAALFDRKSEMIGAVVRD